MKQFLKKIIIVLIQWEAILVLKKYKPQIIAVTGSVGKTSTKDAIFTVLSSKFFVRKSEKSFNSDVGVPLTILGCKNAWNNPFLWAKNLLEGFALLILKNHYPKWLVLEVGADRPGDIRKLARWLKPDVVVITALPDVPVHVEFFDSPEDVAAEKEELVKTLKENGVLVLNNDDEKVRAIAARYRRLPITFGFLRSSLFSASHERIVIKKGIPQGMSFRVDSGGSSVPVTIMGALGKQHVYPALAACAVGSSQGLDMATMAGALSAHETPQGRMKILTGIKKTTVIDDTYNSSPAAVHEALAVMAELHTEGRKIAVLGDMLELGQYSVEEHKKVGQHVAETISILFVVGIRARDITRSALEHGMDENKIFQYEDSARAGKELELMLEEGDIILVKGSQSMRMEKAVLEIMAEPEQAGELLVRQNPEWLAR